MMKYRKIADISLVADTIAIDAYRENDY